MASKYDPADYSTVHRWNSLLRFRFLLGSETILGAYRLVESRWNNAAWCSEGLKRTRASAPSFCRPMYTHNWLFDEQSDSETRVK